MKILISFLIWMLIATTGPAVFAQDNILLITYGADSLTVEGDNDHEQELLIRVPGTIRYNLYLRLFDADVGGTLDSQFGFAKGWDTQTQFELYGKKRLESEVFGVDKTKDNTWHTFVRFSPESGEKVNGDYVFRLHVKGLNGDDGNVFDVFVSRNPNENRQVKGVEIFSHEPTIRLPKENMAAEMRFLIPDDMSDITVHGFDMAWADINMSTAFRPGIRLKSSGQDQWGVSKIELTEIERVNPELTGNQRWGALFFSGGREIPNDATFHITDPDEKRLPIRFPIRVAKKRNIPPVPRVHVKYLSDCHSVAFDASGSSDKNSDKLRYYWDFGDGQKGKGARIIHHYENQAAFDVRLIVTDDSGEVGNSATETLTIHVNQPPIARAKSSKFKVRDSTFKGYDLIAAPGQEFLFDGSDSQDPDGSISQYVWNFDDTSTSTSKAAPHVFKKSGHYEVSLRVEDDSDHPCNHNTAFLNVLINSRPFVEVGKNRIGAVGDVLSFEPEDTYDSDGDISLYSWDLGDKTLKQGKQITHSYAHPGQYVVNLTIEDDSGTQNNAASDQLMVIINDPPVPIGHSDLEFQISDAEFEHRVALGKTIRFDGSESHDPDGRVIAYFWDFGDPESGQKNQARGATASHIYSVPGKYAVTLTVQDNSTTASEKRSVILKVIVNDPPVPKFDIRDSGVRLGNRAAVGETIRFDGSGSLDPDGKIIGHFWDFGDNAEGEGADVAHIYDRPGAYDVTLTVQDDSETASSKQSLTHTVIINAPPVADAGKDQHVTSSTVLFDSSKSKDSDGELTDYHWDFGDGNTGNGPNPVHVYGNPGTYAVELTVTDDSGTLSKQASDEMTVIVNHKPIADAGPDQIGIPGQSFRFDGSKSFDPDGRIRKYQWDFGDGQISKANKTSEISHAYAMPGKYNVQLTVHDDTGHKAAIDKDDAVVSINAAPVAQIMARVSDGNPSSSVSSGSRGWKGDTIVAAPGQLMVFDGKEAYDPDGKIEEYRWNLSSSSSKSVETVMGMTVSRTYPSPGIYSATLTVTDDSGAVNNQSQDKMLIRVNHPPEARPGKNIITCDRTIQFDGSASADPDGDPLAYLWDFGDGTPRRSGGKVLHTYDKGGMYPVILTVDDGTGLKNSKHTAAFTVAINEAPVADAGEDEMVCAGDVVIFSGGRSYDPEGGRLRYHWDFGDGTTATSLNPTNIYKKGGTYQVTLTIEDNSGLACNTSLAQMVVRVAEAPVAHIGEDMTVCANTEVQFDGSESYDMDGQVNRFEWDFGDGTGGGGPRPVHVYKEPGIYPVRLTITGDPTGSCDAKDTAEIIVAVEEAPEVRFTSPEMVPVGKLAAFDASESKSVPETDLGGNGVEIVSWKWDFGDGKSEKGIRTSHMFQKPGRYFVGLTVKTDSGTDCNSVTAQNVVVVNGPPVANAGKDRFVGVNEVVMFDGSGSYDLDGSIVRYQWDFGDGQTATGVAVRHQYRAGGIYPVTLRVTDDTTAENNWAENKILATVNKTPQPVISIGGCPLPDEDCRWLCAGKKTRFSAEGSTDPDGPLKSKKTLYYWDFGDGQSDKGLKVFHTYKTPGKYVCSLIVDDGTGVSNSRGQANEWIIVNHPPLADAGSDQIVCSGETVMFDGSGSMDPDGKIVIRQQTSDMGQVSDSRGSKQETDNPLHYHWDFGEGHAAEGETVAYVFDTPGRYDVRLTVIDNSGTICNATEDEIRVKVNAAPVADAGPDKDAFFGGAHDAVLFDATRSHDPDGDPLTYYWDFGDNSHDSGPQVAHTYTQPGTYIVRVRVSDGEKTHCSDIWDELTVTVRKRENVQ